MSAKSAQDGAPPLPTSLPTGDVSKTASCASHCPAGLKYVEHYTLISGIENVRTCDQLVGCEYDPEIRKWYCYYGHCIVSGGDKLH